MKKSTKRARQAVPEGKSEKLSDRAPQTGADENRAEIVLKIADSRLLDRVDKLRGNMLAHEFVVKCIEAGILISEIRSRQKVERLEFIRAKAEFATLDVEAVTAPLKSRDQGHPITIEVGRLVNAYLTQLKELAARNGNRMPSHIQVPSDVPIEKVAFQVTREILRSCGKQNVGLGARSGAAQL
jgi:hypothetical protein